jgi:hypothetical protein
LNLEPQTISIQLQAFNIQPSTCIEYMSIDN